MTVLEPGSPQVHAACHVNAATLPGGGIGATRVAAPRVCIRTSLCMRICAYAPLPPLSVSASLPASLSSCLTLSLYLTLCVSCLCLLST